MNHWFAVDGARLMQGKLINELRTDRESVPEGKEFTAADCNASAGNERSRILKAAIDESDAQVRIDRLPTVHGDQLQLGQLLQNLLSNAIKYRSERRPEIHVGCERHGDTWRFAVKDNGIGINARLPRSHFCNFSAARTPDGSIRHRHRACHLQENRRAASRHNMVRIGADERLDFLLYLAG